MSAPQILFPPPSGGGGPVGGAGTPNQVAKWTLASTLGDSLISDDGTTLGVGSNFAITAATGNLSTANGAVAWTLATNAAALNISSGLLSLDTTNGKQVSTTANFGVGAAVGTGKAIDSLTLTNGGTGYTNGTYSQVALTTLTGTGTGATADIVVAGGIVTTVVLRSPGQGYAVNDTLSCASIGAGANFVLTVATVTNYAGVTGDLYATRIGAGTKSPVSGVDSVAGLSSRAAFQYTGLSFGTTIANGLNQFVIDSSAEPGGVTVTPANVTLYGARIQPRFDLSANTSGGSAYGVMSQPHVEAVAGTGASTFYGLAGGFRFSNAATTGKTVNTFGVVGASNFYAPLGAGNTFNVRQISSAGLCSATNAQTFIWNDFYGSSAFSGAAHAITSYYGMRLVAPSLSGGATITNRWGISQEDSAAKSAFWGNVGVGNALDVGTGKAIASLTLTAGGTLYTNGTYSQVALTGGTGTGATADIVISGNAVTTVVLRAPGQGYVAGDVLSVNAADVGGTGSGFQTTVATVASILRSDGQVVAPRIGAGTTAPITGLDVASGAASFRSNDFIVRTTGGASPFAYRASVFSSSTFAPTTSASTQNVGVASYHAFDFSGLSTSQSAFAFGGTAVLTASQAGQQVTAYGINVNPSRSSASDLATNATLIGLQGNVSISTGVGSASTATVYGVNSLAQNSASGHTVTTLVAVNAQPYAAAGAIVTTGYGFNLAALATASTWTTFYGIRLQAWSGPTITNRWGISQEDTLANNLFAGVVIHGSGEASASPVGQTLRGPSGSGSNIAGGSITIAGGNSTGSGAGGSIIFQTAAAGGAGSGANTLTTRASIDSAGNLAFNSGFGSAATAYGCRAWVNFNGTGTVAIRSSGNVTSITDNGVGDYTVNMTNAMSDANYAIACSIGGTNGVDIIRLRDESTARTTTAFRLLVMTNGFVQADSAVVNAMVVR